MEQQLVELKDGIFKIGGVTACFYSISNNPAKKKIDHAEETEEDYSVLEQRGYAIPFTNRGTEKLFFYDHTTNKL